jgi:drug/metabolite transporter (DMT)-like permease
MTFKQELNQNLIIKLIFLAVVLAWSTSWIMIKFQIAKVPQGMSIAYRFLGASLLLFAIAKIKKFPLKFSRQQHRLIFLQGINLFFFNHIFFYSAVNYISSGIVATSAALSVIAIPIIDYLIHKNKFSPKILLAGLLGIFGVFMVASSEIKIDSFGLNLFKGLFFCLLGATTFSIGSVVGKELKLNNIKTLISSTAYSMLYGASVSLLVSFATHKELIFDFSFSYISSLIYLILIPGIIGYCSILFLVDKIGSVKASYTALFYPTLALILSGLFENYHFTIFTFLGIILVITSNFIALKSREKNVSP